MILHKFSDIIADLKQISIDIKVPLGIEVDKTSQGIDGKMILGSMPVVRHDNFYDLNFNIVMQYSTTKENVNSLMNKLHMLSEKLVEDKRFLFDGWTKIDDESKIIYQANVIYKNMVSN
jgi:hypothetical protein